MADDAAQTLLHESPVCDAFDRAARGGADEPEVREVDDDAVPAHLAALRARVRRREGGS